MPLRPLTHTLSASILALLLVTLVAVPSLAWDYTELTVIDAPVVEDNPAVTLGQGFSVRVRTMNGDGTVDTSINALLFELFTNHDSTLPPEKYIVNGEIQFDNLVFNAAGTSIQLEARAVDDITAPKGYEWINCYPFVDHFNISVPSGDKWVGQNISVMVTAVDEFGIAIGNFADDVTLSASIGHMSVGPTQLVQGTDFNLGTATVDITFLGTDDFNWQNILTVIGSRIYTGQLTYATGSAVITPLWPGTLNGVILLLPGETLTPGVPPGKTGTPTDQLAGIPFESTVYGVDQYWNPVRDTDPALPVTVDFSTTDLHAAVVLPGSTQLTSNILSNLDMTLISAGQQQVSAEASGNISDISNSLTDVAARSLDYFEFNYVLWDTLEVQVTTQPFDVQITARDFYDNLYPFNGDVSLRVKYGADESENYILSRSNTFVEGQLDTDIQVTMRFFSCHLICDSGGSASSTSGAFKVNPGPLADFLITLPGQTYAPGLSTPGFTGNLGTPNPATAGDLVTPIMVRPVDEYFNMVGGSYFVGASSYNGYFEIPASPDNNFTVTNATPIQVIFRTYGNRSLTVTSSQSIVGTSDQIQIAPAAFDRLAVVAPGETLVPGIFDSIEDDGKSGAPDFQDAGIQFQVGVVATDAYWNPVNESDPSLPLTMNFSSTDGAADLPSAGQVLSTPSGNYNVTLRTLAEPNFQTVQVEDNYANEAFSAVPLQAGVIDHFTIGINSRSNPTPNDPLTPIPDIVAGQLLNDLTIVARDQFGNHIPDFDATAVFTANHGTGILTPTTCDFADGGTWPGSEQGIWRGSVQIFRAGEDVTITITDDEYSRTGISNAFNISAASYADLLLILPGETYTPGLAPGKVGVPYPVEAGVTVNAEIIAVDTWYNQVAEQPTVMLTSSGYSEVTSANPVVLPPDGSSIAELFFRTAGSQTLDAEDITLPDNTDTSVVEVEPGPFIRLQAIAPGETPNPGGYESDGKLGSPDLQTTSLQFPFEVRSVDSYWNLVNNNDEHIVLTSSDDALGDGNPANQGQNLSAGQITFPIFLTASGSVVVEARAVDNLDILPQAITINLLQGSQYIISVPDSAWVGPPQTFSMSVSLVDSLGAPETAANNSVTLTAFKSNLDPATSILWVSQATLSEGVITLPAQAYDTVEDLIIRVSDDAGRQAFSQTIHMLANGLEYHVSVPDTAQTIAGPPAIFPVICELRDTDTGTRIDSDRTLDVTVWSAADGAIGLGMAAIAEASLENGYCVFNQSYSKAENIYIHIEDEQELSGNSAIFTIVADGYKRLQLLVPGEEIRPGQEAFLETGKSGTPDTQRSRITFPVTVRAVDQFWNLVDETTTGAIHFSATDNSIGEGNPEEMDLPFVNGRRTFQLYVESEGQVDLSVWDADNPDPPGQTVSLPVNPGYQYDITVDPEPHTGYPGFQMIVEMIDPVTGEPAPETNHSISISALNTDFSLAAGNLGITEETLAAGVRVINGQQYDRVEPIILRVMDEVGRVGYTDILAMQAGGLIYEIAVPDTAIVGGPSSFPVAVQLLDLATGHVVASQDTVFSVEICSGSTGLIGTGEWSIGSSVLREGICSFNQTYTTAENIYLRISDERGVVGISPTITMLPDGYKRLQLVAPGETPVPGVSSATGKVGEPVLQQAEVPFMMQIRATDQYWNLIDTFAAGHVVLTSSDGSINGTNPVNQGAPLIGGIGDYEVILHDQGGITIFAEDQDSTEILAHSVDIPVGQARYEILVPETALAGPPSFFGVTIRLVKDDGTLITAANNEVYLTALAPNHEQARSQLGSVSAVLAAGELSIDEQTYPIVEDIIIRVTDDLGRESFSPVIRMMPEDVTYEVTVPTTATIGPPSTFDISLRLIDTTTGQLVTSDDRSFTITAYNHNTGELGEGILSLTSGTTSGGLVTIPESYTAAETIFLAIEDDRDVLVYSSPIQIGHGAPQDMQVEVSHDVLEVAQSATIFVTLQDLYGNLVINEPVVYTVLAGDGVLAADSLLTGNLGTTSNVVSVPAGGREDIIIGISVNGLPDRVAEIEVIGPPLTDIELEGSNVTSGHGIMVTPETSFTLNSASRIGLHHIYWGLDLSSEAVPETIYDGSLSFAELGITDYGQHTLSFRGEDIKGNLEDVQVFTIMLGSNLASEKAVTNRPNPFRAGTDETIILFRAKASGTASLRIFDLFGNPVWNADVATESGVVAQVPWDGRNLHGSVVGNGGYVLLIRTGDDTLKRKIAVIK
ncbi:MAG: hypothetical protein GY835_17865 [bacterium]|nr:hypothetical protein [bacterium]